MRIRIHRSFWRILCWFCAALVNFPTLYRFKSHAVPDKTVLIVEPNPYHGEILPGFVKYFSELGYKVELILQLSLKKDSPFVRFDSPPVIFYLPPFGQRTALKLATAKKYDFIFFSTSVLWVAGYKNSYLKFLGFVPEKFFMVEHNIIPWVKQYRHDKYADRLFSLSGFNNIPMLNPHYFGNVQITDKSEITTFAAVLNVRENAALLFGAVRELLSRGIVNFRVVVAGAAEIDKIPADLESHVTITGKISFEKLWKIYEDADFILPCLNPELEIQKKYLGSTTTGSWSNIMAFAKPAVIHSDFAKFYRLDDTNAILYQDNKKFSAAMAAAIVMSAAEYKIMQNNICNLQNE
ncbi:MAG: hypothetical protein LBE20_07455, partial [Deltaproteobacteria bacterium]|nr:hypothetical protein [Deltaproteobacteria bacterium]